MRLVYLFAFCCACVMAALACADLFDEPSQCKTDRDCEKFGPEAACFVAQGICVPKGQLGADGGPIGPGPGEDGGPDATPPRNCKAVALPKPQENVPTDATDGGAGDITTSKTLDCTKDWVIDRRIYVRPGATLTIHENTTIKALPGARLVIAPGARIEAVGKRDEPIVFTSAAAAPTAGSWNGLYILGSAPPNNNQPFANDATLQAGGDNADDGSGVLEFVRVEYTQVGIVFAGAGRGTRVDHVQSRHSSDNGFTFRGGTVNAKHLVCQRPADEQFELDATYTGKLQFVFSQKTPTAANQLGRGGLLLGPNTNAVVYNATILGDNVPVQGFGLVHRDSAMDVNNTIIMGWFTGLDAVGGQGNPLELRATIIANNTNNPTIIEDAGETDAASPDFDDDGAFDELDFFGGGGRNNSTNNPNLLAPFDANNPQPWPAAAITTNARTPPATPENFFDTTAVFIGAFRDGTDNWMSTWTRFGP